MRSSIVSGVAALIASANAIATISTKGSKFFTSDGDQWYIKGSLSHPEHHTTLLLTRAYTGVAYQLTVDDPLSNATQCALDVALMETLGANAIRVYHVDPTADHTGCMSSLADAGIYLFLDLDTFTTAIESVQKPTLP